MTIMEQLIRNEIRWFVKESLDNRFPGSDRPYFDEPLVGFAAADDPLFRRFKTVIGDFHLTPAEIMENTFGAEVGTASTVICWVLPITRSTCESNRGDDGMPSREWALTRSNGEKFNTLLRMYVVELLGVIGFQGVAPLLSGMWRPVRESNVGMASTWSERHAAYAAGLGTFSLNDGFITEKGIAHRCGSVITNAVIAASPRNSASPWSNCLYFREGGCGLCIPRCPVGAISWNGHDKDMCSAYVYGALRNSAGQLYGIMETGCGLCQTRVPCESHIPSGKKKDTDDERPSI
jgi:epoxyqueuosine reductase QueG